MTVPPAQQPEPGQGLRTTTRRTFVSTAATAALGLVLVGCGGQSLEIICNDNMVFEPETLRIRGGDTVTWRNLGQAMVHTATGDPAKALDPTNVTLPNGVAPWDSGPIGPGESWQHTFSAPGEYRYVCLPHELAGMLGTIVVEG